MILISICPHLHNESGHDAGYAKAVTAASREISLSHWVLVSTDCAIHNPPPNWLSALPPARKAGAVVGRLQYWTRFSRAVSDAIRQIRHREGSQEIAILMESFTVGHLASVVVALSRLPAPARLCLLYRTTTELRHVNGVSHKILLGLARRVAGLPLTLLSDSRQLEEAVGRFFEQPVFTMPIPHTHGLASEDRTPPAREEILCWWPGPPRPNKGHDAIRALAARPDRTGRICLMVSNRAGVKTGAASGLRVIEVPDPLPESEYVSLMLRSMVILLPYDPAWYRESTSGIFVEAVCAGKIPLVTADTWMAYELARFRLERLVIDWSRPDLVDEICMLTEDREILSGLAQMRRQYLQYHNPRSFGVELQKVLLGSH